MALEILNKIMDAENEKKQILEDAKNNCFLKKQAAISNAEKCSEETLAKTKLEIKEKLERARADDKRMRREQTVKIDRECDDFKANQQDKISAGVDLLVSFILKKDKR